MVFAVAWVWSLAQELARAKGVDKKKKKKMHSKVRIMPNLWEEGFLELDRAEGVAPRFSGSLVV